MPNKVVIHMPEPVSGAARYVYELVRSLALARMPVVLLCPSNYSYREQLSGKVVVVCSTARGTAEGASLFARVLRNLTFFVMMCLQQITLLNPGDVIHFQFVQYFPLGLLPFLLAKIQRCPIVFTAHDPVPHKWLLPPSLRFLERRGLRYAYTLSSRIVVHNEIGRQLIVREFSQPPSKIAIIPHGPFSVGDLPVPENDSGILKLLTFGSIRENKGLHLAIEAVQQINSGAKKVELVIAGSLANAREGEYWARCLALVAGAPDGITVFARFIQEEETRRLLAQCDAMLLPYTEFSSESGVASLALASSRPIISTRAGGLGDLLDAVDLGIEISSATVQSVADAVGQALRIGPRELREKGLRGQRLMQNARSWDAIGARTADLYETLLPQRQRRKAA